MGEQVFTLQWVEDLQDTNMLNLSALGSELVTSQSFS